MVDDVQFFINQELKTDQEDAMEKVVKKIELKVTADDRVGVISDVTHFLAERGINVENFCAYTAGGKAFTYLLTDDNEKAKRILAEQGFLVEEREVIVLSLWNRPGSLSHVAALFKRKGINLQSVYGTSSSGGEKMTMIFLSEDNEKALEAFDQMVLQEAEK
jgi:hypothetical protein